MWHVTGHVAASWGHAWGLERDTRVQPALRVAQEAVGERDVDTSAAGHVRVWEQNLGFPALPLVWGGS